MIRQIMILAVAILAVQVTLFAQHPDGHIEHSDEHFRPFRVAVLVGHTVIPAEYAGKKVYVPSWGLDLEYWISPGWGVGLHNDVELESFVVQHSNGDEEIERHSPVVMTLDALFKPWKGLVLQLGPGIEFERSENYAVLRAGIEYEFEFGDGWDIAPTIFYDTRFDAYQTWSFALGVGKRF